MFQVSLHQYSGVGTVGSHSSSIFKFWGNSTLFSIVAAPVEVHISSALEFPFSPHPHHHLSFDTPGVGDGQGGLACWGRKESDTTERLNWTEYIIKTHRRNLTYSNKTSDTSIKKYKLMSPTNEKPTISGPNWLN